MTQVRDYARAIGQLVDGSRLDGEIALDRERQRDVRDLVDLTKPLRILDLANGRLRPQFIILQAHGYSVFGIDLANNPSSDAFGAGYRLARWLYAIRLHRPGSKSKADTLACADVDHLPFARNLFDLVTSIAAFEHFLDVHCVISELSRVLRPGGAAYIRLHPFTAASGGHNVKLMEIPLSSLPKGVEPWDHLRKRRLPFQVPLNEWRISQYLEAFAQHFEIIKHYCAMREGEHLLTHEVLADLPGYTVDELTCGAYVIVARKPAA